MTGTTNTTKLPYATWGQATANLSLDGLHLDDALEQARGHHGKKKDKAIYAQATDYNSKAAPIAQVTAVPAAANAISPAAPATGTQLAPLQASAQGTTYTHAAPPPTQFEIPNQHVRIPVEITIPGNTHIIKAADLQLTGAHTVTLDKTIRYEADTIQVEGPAIVDGRAPIQILESEAKVIPVATVNTLPTYPAAAGKAYDPSSSGKGYQPRPTSRDTTPVPEQQDDYNDTPEPQATDKVPQPQTKSPRQPTNDEPVEDVRVAGIPEHELTEETPYFNRRR